MTSKTWSHEHPPPRELVPALDTEPDNLSADALAFLHKTVSADDAELKRCLIDVQKKAYALNPYPCIRSFSFADCVIAQSFVYNQVMRAGAQRNTLFLDLACCVGTDARRLVADGYPAAHVLASDLRSEFLELGHELFRDRATSGIHFFAADALDPDFSTAPGPRETPVGQVTRLDELRGRLDHVYVGWLFHLFNKETQEELARRVGALLRRRGGDVVFGVHQGQEKEGLLRDKMFGDRYVHSPASWERMWKDVFAKLEGVEWAERHVRVRCEMTQMRSKFVDFLDDFWHMSWAVEIVDA